MVINNQENYSRKVFLEWFTKSKVSSKNNKGTVYVINYNLMNEIFLNVF